jgi:hypothetical protein
MSAGIIAARLGEIILEKPFGIHNQLSEQQSR